MAKLRKEYKNGFTTVSNEMYRDKSLPLKERGLLSTMMSLPDNWNFSIIGLASILQDGESAVRSALKNLEKLGYLRRKRITDEKSGRVIDWEYIFADYPVFSPDVENQHVDNQHEESPDVLYPQKESPAVEVSTQSNNNKLNINKFNNKDIDDIRNEIFSFIIENSSAQQLRTLEANNYNPEYIGLINNTRNLIQTIINSLPYNHLLTLLTLTPKDSIKLWDKTYSIIEDNNKHIENKEAYLRVIIENMINVINCNNKKKN